MALKTWHDVMINQSISSTQETLNTSLASKKELLVQSDLHYMILSNFQVHRSCRYLFIISPWFLKFPPLHCVKLGISEKEVCVKTGVSTEANLNLDPPYRTLSNSEYSIICLKKVSIHSSSQEWETQWAVSCIKTASTSEIKNSLPILHSS